MSVAAVANKEDKKTLYKDYVSFLGSYKQGRKDEVDDKEGRCSPSISSNNSSTSITSDLNDMPKKSFKEYLENYNNKKFNPVQADFKKNPNQNVEGKIVKTEVFIDINNDINSSTLISKTFDLNIEPHKEYHKQKSGIDMSSRSSESQENVNTPVFQLKTSNESGQRKIIIDEISHRKMENNIPSTEIKKHPLISKTFDLNIEPHKEYQKQKTGIDMSSRSSDQKAIPESQENINTTVFQLKTNNESGQRKIIIDEISQRKMANNIPSTEIKKHPLKKTSSITEKSKIFEKISTKNKANCRVEAAIGVPPPARNGCLPPKPVLHKGMSPEIHKDSFTKPKLAKNGVDLSAALAANIQHTNSQSEIVAPENSTTGSLLPATVISCSTLPQKNISCGIPPPPPPPPPVNNFSPKKLSISPKPNFNSNGKSNYNTMPKLQNTKQIDTMDGCAPPALDRNDPRMKKMVYGALREMYGAYHDKANDYLATLPKNRVKKNNGLDSIINSIASQGGLEKLTGRGNPKVEAE